MTLRTRINLITIGVMLAVLGAVYYATDLQKRQRENQFTAAILKERQMLWKRNITVREEEMIDSGGPLLHDKTILAALESGNATALHQSAGSTFNLLRAQNNLEALVLTSLTGDIVYSSAPQSITDGTGKLLAAALNDGRINKGLQRSETGKLQIVTVLPLRSRGEIIGAGIFIMGLQKHVDQFKNQMGGDVYLLTPKYKIEYSTHKPPNGLTATLAAAGNRGVMLFKDGDTRYDVMKLPLYATDNTLLGYLVSTSDNTRMYQQKHRTDLIATTITIAAILLGLVLSSWGSGRIVKQVKNLVGINQKIAQGKLDNPITLQPPNTEIGQLLLAADSTQKTLLHLVSEVLHSSHRITTASSDISRKNHRLASRTEEQANSLETTTSSVEEIASTARQNADNADSANQLAQTMMEQANAGESSTVATVQAVEDINERSQQIEAIVTMIDEIAFQTNLLALNASVEAARAGEQGKGFAVVAGEVRNLAERSAKAANEVKTLITDTRETISRGVSLAAGSGEALERIIASMKQVTDLIEEIAIASSQQAAGINEINRALSLIDNTTQENRVLVDETAHASIALVDEAGKMQQLMQFFSLPESNTSGSLRRASRQSTSKRAEADAA